MVGGEIPLVDKLKENMISSSPLLARSQYTYPRMNGRQLIENNNWTSIDQHVTSIDMTLNWRQMAEFLNCVIQNLHRFCLKICWYYPFSHNHGSVERYPKWKEPDTGDMPLEPLVPHNHGRKVCWLSLSSNPWIPPKIKGWLNHLKITENWKGKSSVPGIHRNHFLGVPAEKKSV